MFKLINNSRFLANFIYCLVALSLFETKVMANENQFLGTEISTQSMQLNLNKQQLQPTSKSENVELESSNLSPEIANISQENLTLPANNLISQIPQQGASINKIEVRNNSIFQSEINELIKPLENTTVRVEQLRELANKITELYVTNGYITTKAVYQEGEIINNTAVIDVFEGEIQEVQITGAQRLENYVRQRINLGISKPLNSSQLEDQLRLLKANPLLENIEASLKQGTGENQSILVVNIEEANPFFGSFGFDNYSPPSIGGVEMVLDLGYRNVFGLGDTFSVSYAPRVETFTGTYDLDFNYSIPLNAMDGTLFLRTSLQENTVIDDRFSDFDISGKSQYYDITYRQPLIRNPREEFALSVGMSYRNGDTFISGFPDDFGDTQTNVITFGQDYILRQPSGAWAFRSQFRTGIGLFDVTKSNKNGDPDGYFFAWLGQIQRVQVIDDNNLLIIQGDIQLTPDALLSSEQFVIGGGQSVRGYRQNVRAGDNGFRFSIEDRITLVRNDQLDPVFQLAPFFDMGSVWNSGVNQDSQVDQRFIAALGLGLIWQPVEGMNIRLDYAPPLVDLKDRGNDVQDDGFYFQVNYNW
jgi:hemolysin activation/secretion protein